eukprot:8156506-Pyramimonas_sp.AAC.1
MDAALYPGRGIVAGSTTATYEAKVFLKPGVDRFTTNMSDSASLSLHVDDLTLQQWGNCMGWVVGALKELAESVRSYLEIELQLPLAYHKFGIASSS